ncbi:MAG TPA: LysM peptidoglycan-binding domain-containing protein [Polyangiaceae bacterium]|jgi:hypothetical protein|nr:LysM peptidoglycan-binding domain-containing protein [Polyangiaceae bacterium]
MRGLVLCLCGVLFTLSVAGQAQAFPHIVKQGETLAGLAEEMYGAVQLERVLVAANSLVGANASPIVPGMVIEIPAPSHYRTQAGDTFAGIATDRLGAPNRAEFLAEVNRTKPWLQPDPATLLIVPYNLRVVCSADDTLSGLAYKFLGDRKKTWALDQYNGLKGRALHPGDTVLIPLVDLPLTEAGKKAALGAEAVQQSQALGESREIQLTASALLPKLAGDVRNGRYIEAVVKGVGILQNGQLSHSQTGIINRQLLEAYVALGAKGRAADSCQAWLDNDPTAVLDPVSLSPKILAACAAAKATAPAHP